MTKMDKNSEAAYQSGWGIFVPFLDPTWSDLPPARPAASAGRKRRVDWGESLLNAAWLALILTCAVECGSRLLWAVQP